MGAPGSERLGGQLGRCLHTSPRCARPRSAPLFTEVSFLVIPSLAPTLFLPRVDDSVSCPWVRARAPVPSSGRVPGRAARRCPEACSVLPQQQNGHVSRCLPWCHLPGAENKFPRAPCFAAD